MARSAVDEQALQGTEQPFGAAGEARQFDEPVREWLPRVAARELLAREGFQNASTISLGGAAMSALVEFEVLGPEAQAGVADDVGSRQTTFISVSLKSECSFRFAEPIVSHASSTMPDLRVDVDGVAERAVAGIEGAGEQPSVAVVGFDQLGRDPRVSSAPVLGLAGSSSSSRKPVRRGLAEFVARTSAISGDQRNWFSR